MTTYENIIKKSNEQYEHTFKNAQYKKEILKECDMKKYQSQLTNKKEKEMKQNHSNEFTKQAITKQAKEKLESVFGDGALKPNVIEYLQMKDAYRKRIQRISKRTLNR